jgi:hydroxypyruvate isomerase
MQSPLLRCGISAIEENIMTDQLWNRRAVLQTLGSGAAGAAVAGSLPAADEPAKPKGNIKQSVCRWCYGKLPLDKLATEIAKIGYKSIELLNANDIKAVKGMGLTCAVMSSASSISDGVNRKENHDAIEKQLRTNIEFAAAEGIPNVLVMSGNRHDKAGKVMPDDEGMENCAIFLKKVVGFAEEKKITVLMEGLNSKKDHKDYMYDKTPWGVALAKKVGSPRFKLLYDIYHMQIMEGDVIATSRQYKEYIGHYHTGGVPGRNEIDDTQELHYPAIIKAILETGYQGYLGQEFIPKREPVASLGQAFRICDV